MGVTASYVCDKGFTLRGSVVRVCLPSGEWSGQEPTCFGEQWCIDSYDRFCCTLRYHNFAVQYNYNYVCMHVYAL